MARVTDVQRSEIESVTLELSAKEARVLMAIFRHVGGPPEGPRGKMDNVQNALQRAGLLHDVSVKFTGPDLYIV
jgi:hypothetical protein